MSEYIYLGNFSAVDPVYSRAMRCDDCQVSWTGCWDNFQCPKCGKGELPESCSGLLKIPMPRKEAETNE